MTAIGGSPFALPSGGGCNYDYNVAAEASGNFVYTVDANDGTAAYTVNQSTGALTLASSSFFASPAGAFTVTTVPNAMSSTATVTGLSIMPSEVAQITTSSLGKQYQFTLKATYSDGSTGFLTESASWSSSDQTVATVAAGLATSTGYGMTTITASIGGQSATASLTVNPLPPTSITVTPQSITLHNGTALQLKATGQYSDGSSLDLTNSVVWSSPDTSVATVSSHGFLQAAGLGTTTISATDSGVSGSVAVTVVAPTNAPTRNGAFVFTGGNGYSGSPTPVSGYGINKTSGTLSVVAGSPFALPGRLLSMVGDPTGEFVYASSDDGSLSAFTVDSQAGSLTPVPGSPYAVASSGSNDWSSGMIIAIDPAGKYLYVAGGSKLYGFSIDAGSGALTAISGSPFTLNASAVAIDPSGRYLVVYNGTGVQSYAIASGTGTLAAAGGAASGCGGSHMTFEPSGHYLYATTGAGIAACSFDSSTGALTAVTGSPFATSSGASFMGVTAHPSGSFLYATDSTCADSGPQNRLYAFVIDPSTGALTAIGGSPFALPSGGGCNYNFEVAAEASGNFVYTIDANDGVAAYTVNASTGALTQASPFSGPAANKLITIPNAMSAAATVTGLSIMPSEGAQITTSSLGKQYQFTLKATYSDGSTGFLTASASWSSSDQTVATVAAGLATSTGYGMTTITASIGGQSATANLTVIMPSLSSISIAPQTVTLYAGTALQLKATGTYADGSNVDLTKSVAWGSSDNAIANVTAQGLMQTLAIGSTQITATDKGISGTASVTALTPFAWKTPAPIKYGTPLDATQLDATSGALGTYVYNPPSGTILSVGSQALKVAFTPDPASASNPSILRESTTAKSALPKGRAAVSDSSSYLAVNATVYLKVNSAPLSVTANNATMAYGSTLPALNGTLTGVVSGDGITASYATTATSSSPAGTYPITATLNDPHTRLANYTVSNTPGTLTIGKVTPLIAWTTPAPLIYGETLSAVLNASASFNSSAVAGAFSYAATPSGGAASPVTPSTVLPAGSYTLTVNFAPTESADFNLATQSVNLTVNNPQPSIGGLSPAFASQGGSAFKLTITGNGFVPTSTIKWGTMALPTQYTSATQLTAQVPASDIAASGTAAITILNSSPGGGTSSAMQFEIDSVASVATTQPSFTTFSVTVAPGSTATYPVTLSSSATNVSASCLNLPSGASCSYSASTGAVTITTSSTTPAGTYQITVVFTESLPGATTAMVFLPILLLPLVWPRRKSTALGRTLLLICAAITFSAALVVSGCGGGGGSMSGGGGGGTQTHTVTNSGTVSLIVK